MTYIVTLPNSKQKFNRKERAHRDGEVIDDEKIRFTPNDLCDCKDYYVLRQLDKYQSLSDKCVTELYSCSEKHAMVLKKFKSIQLRSLALCSVKQYDLCDKPHDFGKLPYHIVVEIHDSESSCMGTI